jgi:hypothetical protein
MQQRRFRPGDVLDDYCPRERRITDHAIVAMIDDQIKQTRCVVCDAEHEFKEGKVPAQRRRRPKAALFNQVLDGLQGPQPAARLAHHADVDPEAEPETADADSPVALPMSSGNGHRPAEMRAADMPPPVIAEAPPACAFAEPAAAHQEPASPSEEGPVRRPLIRATLPRPEGQPLVTRSIPEFTIRQPNNGRGGHRPGGRRREGHHQGQGAERQMRFGRGGQGHGGQGQRQHPSGRPHRRRGGKKR